MRGQKTDRVLFAFRIGDPEGIHTIYDDEGSQVNPGRWNTDAAPVIYTSEHYSTALLEKLIYANGLMPPNQHFVRITIPNGTSYEVFQPEAHPNWDGKDESICKQFGAEWCATQRTALLLVPSIPARLDRNILINPAHPDARAIVPALPEPVWWDERLYR